MKNKTEQTKNPHKLRIFRGFYFSELQVRDRVPESHFTSLFCLLDRHFRVPGSAPSNDVSKADLIFVLLWAFGTKSPGEMPRRGSPRIRVLNFTNYCQMPVQNTCSPSTPFPATHELCMHDNYFVSLSGKHIFRSYWYPLPFVPPAMPSVLLGFDKIIIIYSKVTNIFIMFVPSIS